jgi:hypothetical protein
MTRPDKISPAAFRQVYQEVVPDPADRSGQSSRNHRLGDNLKVQFEELHLPEIERQTFRLCYDHQIRNSLLQVDPLDHSSGQAEYPPESIAKYLEPVLECV